jgi:predicted small secreted protein
MIGELKMSKLARRLALATLLLISLLLAGCSSNIGVGLSVGIPVGDHGYINVGGSSNRWY